MNITKNTLKYLIKETMYDMANAKTPDPASYIENEVEKEAEREISWGKVLDSLNLNEKRTANTFETSY